MSPGTFEHWKDHMRILLMTCMFINRNVIEHKFATFLICNIQLLSFVTIFHSSIFSLLIKEAKIYRGKILHQYASPFNGKNLILLDSKSQILINKCLCTERNRIHIFIAETAKITLKFPGGFFPQIGTMGIINIHG